MKTPSSRVVPLDELNNYEVADGDPDVRGWQVVGSDRREIGEVDDLLVDRLAMKVRYLDVDLGTDFSSGEHDRHILIPIGYARVDEVSRRVVVDALEASTLAAIPAYRHQPVTQDYEVELRTVLDSEYTGAPAVGDSDFYTHNLYDEARFFGARGTTGSETHVTLSDEELAVIRREQVAGEVEIKKEVETRHVRENVPVRREEVVVERRPAIPGMAAEARISEEEVRIPISKEELVVEKRTVPKEELVVRKQYVVEEETVEADLRSERADVRPRGDVDVRERS